MAEILGFVGVGKMGSRMAARLLDAGHDLVVYDIREEAMAPLVARRAAKASSSRELADRSDIVFFSLPGPQEVEGEAIGGQGVIAGTRAKILVDLSTTGPRTIGLITNRLASEGIAVIDAPVSGGVAGAAKGTLIRTSFPRAAIRPGRTYSSRGRRRTELRRHRRSDTRRVDACP